MKSALALGLLLTVLLVSGCTQTGVKQITLDSLIAAGMINIGGVYPAEFNRGVPVPAGCKSMRQFQWGPSVNRRAFFSVVECHNETAASDIIAVITAMSETPVITPTINGVETNVATDNWGIHYTWTEGNFAIVVGGITDDYARIITEALIRSYK